MKFLCHRLTPILALGFVCLWFPGALASTPAGKSGDSAAQRSDGVALPTWEEGECRESFDIRIWPEDVVVWLEQQHLRDLIADPETPPRERKQLERILAMQRAWRTQWVTPPDPENESS